MSFYVPTEVSGRFDFLSFLNKEKNSLVETVIICFQIHSTYHILKSFLF